MTTSKSTESVGANSRPPPGQTKISDFDSDNGHCQWLQLDSEEIRQPDVRIPHAIRATERNKDWKTKSPENFSVLRALGIAKVAVKKRFEPVSVACQLVPNPLITGFPSSSSAQFVAIRPYDFDTFSTPAAKAAL